MVITSFSKQLLCLKQFGELMHCISEKKGFKIFLLVISVIVVSTVLLLFIGIWFWVLKLPVTLLKRQHKINK